MIVFLLGLPGVGKTHCGPLLAHHLNFTFLDLDACIERQFNDTIPNIIHKQGVLAFRDIEQKVLSEVIAAEFNGNTVIACGGGTPCYNNNMLILKETGITIYIRDLPEVIAKRLRNSKTQRPLLNTKSADSIYKSLNELLELRRPFYEQSHIITGVLGLLDFHLFTNRLELFTDRHKTGFHMSQNI